MLLIVLSIKRKPSSGCEVGVTLTQQCSFNSKPNRTFNPQIQLHSEPHPNSKPKHEVKSLHLFIKCEAWFYVVFVSLIWTWRSHNNLFYYILCCQETDGAPHDLEVTEEATPSSTQEAEDALGGATEVCSWFGMIDSIIVVVVFLTQCSLQQDVTAEEANEQLPEDKEPPPSGKENQ